MQDEEQKGKEIAECGHEADEFRSVSVTNMFTGRQFWVCSTCYDKYILGDLDAEDLFLSE